MKWNIKFIWQRAWQTEVSPLAKVAQTQDKLLQARLSVLGNVSSKSMTHKFYVAGYETGAGDQKYHDLDKDIKDLLAKRQGLAEQKSRDNKWGWWNRLISKLPIKWQKKLRVNNEYDIALAESWELSQKIRYQVLSFAEDLYAKQKNNFNGSDHDITTIISEMKELLKLVDSSDPLYHYMQGLVALKTASTTGDLEAKVRAAEELFLGCKTVVENNSEALALYGQDINYFQTMAQLHGVELRAKKQSMAEATTSLAKARQTAMTNLSQQGAYPLAHIQEQRLALVTGTAIEFPAVQLMALKQLASQGYPLAWALYGDILRHYPQEGRRSHYAEFARATKDLGLATCVGLTKELSNMRPLETSLEAHLQMNEELARSIKSKLLGGESVSPAPSTVAVPMSQPTRSGSFTEISSSWSRATGRRYNASEVSTHSAIWSRLLRTQRARSETAITRKTIAAAQQAKVDKALVAAIMNMHATHDLATQDAVIAEIAALQPQLGEQLRRYNFLLGAEVARVRSVSESTYPKPCSDQQKLATIAAHNAQPQPVGCKAVLCTNGLKDRPTASSASYRSFTQKFQQAAAKVSTALEGSWCPTRPWL